MKRLCMNPGVMLVLASMLILALPAVAPAVAGPQENGSVRVMINPAQAREDGARWRLLDSPYNDWYVSGHVRGEVPPGDYYVEFLQLRGWSTPQRERITVRSGRVTLLTVTYGSGSGSLTVTIWPEEAAYFSDPSMGDRRWRITGMDGWFASGETLYDLAPGAYTVEFASLSGWTRPADTRANVRNGELTEVRAEYTQSRYLGDTFGALTVDIEPKEATAAGAMWRLEGTDQWYKSGDTAINISPGNYNIEFKNIERWRQPQILRTSVKADEVINLKQTYVSSVGGLKVTIEPPEAAKSGATWSHEGSTAWFRSGNVANEILEGEVTVRFQKVNGWRKPDDQRVKIEAGRTTEITKTLVPEHGSVDVTIRPDEAANSGAKWRIAGLTDWRSSGSPKENVPVGSYTIEFKDINNWEKPGNEHIRVIDEQTARASGEYKAMRGSLAVTIEPQRAIDDGAEWRIKGRDEWHRSGFMRSDLPSDTYVVQFKVIKDWNKPDDITVTVPPNKDAKATGVYRAQRRATLTVTIKPPAAANGGAAWRIVGQQEWLQSGQTTDRITPGQVVVEFKNMPDWKKPANQTINIAPEQEATMEVKYEKK